MRVPVVNDQDEIIGHKDRQELLQSDIYRATGLWITNSRGDMLLARRAMTKKNDPGKWGPAVAGTVEEGEAYEQNILKEAAEELGLKNITVEPWFKKRVSGEHNYFGQWFKAVIDVPAEDLVLQESEVMEVGWFSKDRLLGLIESNPEMFIYSFRQWIENVFSKEV